MSLKKFKLSIFLGFLTAFLMKAGFVLALEVTNYPTILGYSVNGTSFPEYARYIFAIIMIAAFMIAVIVMVFGGVYYLVSLGRGKFTDEGKDWFKAGLLGFLIVLCSYLILYTINKDIVNFKLSGLPEVALQDPSSFQNKDPDIKITSYTEIPMGILTENLLTNTLNSCYAYDMWGNPIPGDKIQTSDGKIDGPTYLDHDRIDCLLQLVDGAQKISQTIASLSDAIVLLMAKCECTEQKCEDTCGGDAGCSGPTSCPGGVCYGACVGGACKAAGGTNGDCCPTGVKKQIEHGPVELPCQPITSVQPYFGDPTTAPGANDAVCTVNGNGGIITETSPVQIKIGPNVTEREKNIIQQAVNMWNAIMKEIVGHNVFGSVTYDNNITNNYCFPNIVTGYCEGGSGSSWHPGVIGIINSTIDTQGTWAWNPAAYNAWDIQNGAVSSVIVFDPTNQESKNDHYFKMIMLHELGHSLGLADSYDTSTGKANADCLYKSIMDWPQIMNNVGEADITALEGLYGSASSYNVLNNFIAVENNDLISNIKNTLDLYNIQNYFISASPETTCQTTDPSDSATYCTGGGKCVNGVCTMPSNNKVTCQTTDPSDSATYCTDGGKCVNGVCKYGGEGYQKYMDIGCDTCNYADYAGLDEFRCSSGSYPYKSCSVLGYVEKQFTLPGIYKTITVVDPKKWNTLNLIQKLHYFQDKIKSIQSKITIDLTQLELAETAIGKCYLAKSYVDLVKKEEQTDMQKEVMTAERIFTNSSGKVIYPTKYCKGFNYANSSCSKKCNNLCPDSSDEVIKCYKKCSDKSGDCSQNDKDCVKRAQQECVEDCYTSRPCTNYSPSNSTSNPWNNDKKATFSDCMDYCMGECGDVCEEKYFTCTGEYGSCADQCWDDSFCHLYAASNTCIFGAAAIIDCVNEDLDDANIKFCIDNAYTCKNGSDQYAAHTGCIENNQSFYDEGFKEVISCSECYNSSYYGFTSYSIYPLSSFLYYHPECLKCESALNPAASDSVCYNKNNITACQVSCPETSSCPASSDCPDCQCTEINKNIGLLVPGESNGSNIGKEGGAIVEYHAQAAQLVGPECNEYSYNDDPLTFYCPTSWWTDPNREGLSQKPIGDAKICSEGDKIPVGELVDSAESWANEMLYFISDTNNYIKNIIKYAETKAGKAINHPVIKDYCKCNAQFENRKPVCTTNCKLNARKIEGKWDCSCTFQACTGASCKQVSSYLKLVWNNYRGLKIAFNKFYVDSLQEPRSDLLKLLSYSRKKVNDCSLVYGSYEKNAAMYSCTRVEDELMPNVNNGQLDFYDHKLNGYCYGVKVGELFNLNLTDDWFCCIDYKNEKTLKK